MIRRILTVVALVTLAAGCCYAADQETLADQPELTLPAVQAVSVEEPACTAQETVAAEGLDLLGEAAQPLSGSTCSPTSSPPCSGCPIGVHRCDCACEVQVQACEANCGGNFMCLVQCEQDGQCCQTTCRHGFC